MRVKYNRVSTSYQTGNRFTVDKEKYDLVLLDVVSGTVPFKERENAKKLVELVELGKVDEIITEDWSRLGRNTGDVINTLFWLEGKEVNVKIRNLGIESRPNGNPNPIWKLLSATMSSLYELELDSIKERTSVGRMVYVQNGGKLGRPSKSTENYKTFLAKEKNQQILKLLKKERTYSEIAKILSVSPKTIRKVKDIAEKEGVLVY